MKHLEEYHDDMPPHVLQRLYADTETSELKKILKKFRQCKHPDDYMLICTQIVENELLKREKKI